jgi:hypothetical protein
MTYPAPPPPSEVSETETVFDRIRALPPVPVTLNEIVAWAKGEEPENQEDEFISLIKKDDKR